MSKWEATAHSEVLFKCELLKGFLRGSGGKESPCLQETQETRVRSLGQEDPLEKGTSTHSGILAWRIPCTEEPLRLQFTGSQTVRHD